MAGSNGIAHGHVGEAAAAEIAHRRESGEQRLARVRDALDRVARIGLREILGTASAPRRRRDACAHRSAPAAASRRRDRRSRLDPACAPRKPTMRSFSIVKTWSRRIRPASTSSRRLAVTVTLAHLHRRRQQSAPATNIVLFMCTSPKSRDSTGVGHRLEPRPHGMLRGMRVMTLRCGREAARARTVASCRRRPSGQVLIKVKACAVCRTDLHVDRWRSAGYPPSDRARSRDRRRDRVRPAPASTMDGRHARRRAVARLDLRHLRALPSRRGKPLCAGEVHGRQIDGGYADFAIADHRYCLPLPAEIDDAACRTAALRRADRLSRVAHGR